MSLPVLDRIEVTWHDVWFSDGRGWESRESYEATMEPMTSIGYHVETNKAFLVLAMTLSADEYGGLFRIPVGAVVSSRTIK